MGKTDSCLKLKLPFTCLMVLMISVIFLEVPALTQTLTASVGRPYQGRLISGVPFPTQFPGYVVRDPERAYATPEAIATVLDAIDAVRERYPDTCNLFIGDFSREGGGWLNMHRSHQNGRDVDLGMYAKGNRPLDTFVPMNEDTLDVAKTWCLLDSLLRSQHIQYIFLDRRIQRHLHEYALNQGVDPGYLEQVFANGRHSPLQHVGGHYDHMHVRFYTPWSTKAARLGDGDEPQRTEIETAQQAYLPQKVNYYVKNSDRSLVELAQSFGVNQKDLCRWNQLTPDDAPIPGSCLVFYKRSFEAEPVRLARSLQPDSVADSPGLHFDGTGGAGSRAYAYQYTRVRDRRSVVPVAATYTVRRGGSLNSLVPAVYTAEKHDTLQKIAKQQGIDLDSLCKINGLKKSSALKAGQKIRLCRPEASSKGAAGSASQVKAASSSAVKQKAASNSAAKQKVASPTTLQKNMKALPITPTKAGAGYQKVQPAAQKAGAKAPTTQGSVKLTKDQKKPAK